MANDRRLVFISYSRVDSDFAYRLRADLEASGFTTWIDTAKLSDQGGQEWLRLIQDAVDACQAMVVIVSPDSINSRYVHMEYHRAQKLSKLVIPIHYRTVTSAPIDLDLDQWIEFRSDQRVNEPYQIGLTNLIRSLMRVPTPPQYPDLPQAPKAVPLTIFEGADIPEFRPVLPPPPPPPQELTTLMTAAYDARGIDDLAGELYFIQQIIAQDRSFAGGTFVQRYEEVTRQIEAQRIKRLRAIARGAMAEKQWRRALGGWQALLEVRPSDGEAKAGARTARIERAKEALRDGDLDESVGTWQALLRLTPADATAQNGLRAALRARADDAWRRADWTRAAESWETLRSHFPSDTEAQSHLNAIQQNQRGDIYYQSAKRSIAVGNVDGARAALEDLYRAAPNYGDPQNIAPKASVQVPAPSFLSQLQTPVPNPSHPSVNASPKQHRLPTVSHTVIFGALAMILIASCVFGVLFYNVPSLIGDINSTQATQTTVAQTIQTAQAQSTQISEANALQTAEAQTGNTSPFPYYASLTDVPQDWPEDKDCFGKTDGYHIVGNWICGLGGVTIPSNTEIGVTAKVLSAKQNIAYGIAFRYTPTLNTYYYFGITRSGEWVVVSVVNDKSTIISARQQNTAIRSGVGVSNVLLVLVIGSQFKFFVNGHLVGTLHNSTIRSGKTAGIVVSDTTSSSPANVIFTDFLMTPQ